MVFSLPVVGVVGVVVGVDGRQWRPLGRGVQITPGHGRLQVGQVVRQVGQVVAVVQFRVRPAT